MKDRIREQLEGTIDEIFFQEQRNLGIESGDIYPIDALLLMEYTDKLADIIERILETALMSTTEG